MRGCEWCEYKENKWLLYKSLHWSVYYDNDLVISKPDGAPYRRDVVSNNFGQPVRHLEMPHIRFHDLRRTFASILINQDVPLLNVSTFLGHSDLSTTANIYAHLDKSKKQESADVISSIFNKAKE